MRVNSKKFLAITVAASLAVSGCATMGIGTGEPTTVEQRIARCGALVLGGALLATLAGGDDGRNAAIGAAVGGATCAAWWALDNRRDRQRIAEMQRIAAITGQPQTGSWPGEGQDTRRRDVVVQPSTQTEMVVLGGERRVCRPMHTTAAVAGQRNSMSEVWCRDAAGNWAAAPDAAPIA